MIMRQGVLERKQHHLERHHQPMTSVINMARQCSFEAVCVLI